MGIADHPPAKRELRDELWTNISADLSQGSRFLYFFLSSGVGQLSDISALLVVDKQRAEACFSLCRAVLEVLVPRSFPFVLFRLTFCIFCCLRIVSFGPMADMAATDETGTTHVSVSQYIKEILTFQREENSPLSVSSVAPASRLASGRTCAPVGVLLCPSGGTGVPGCAETCSRPQACRRSPPSEGLWRGRLPCLPRRMSAGSSVGERGRVSPIWLSPVTVQAFRERVVSLC